MVTIANIGKVLKKSRVALTLVMVILGMGALAPAAAVRAMPGAQAQDEMAQLEMLSGKEFEVEFLSMMIHHHQMAIDMAMLAPDRANRQEVKDAAEKIISDQTREIGEMTGWLKQWYNADPNEIMMSDDMTAMMSRLESLRGDEFDKEFLMMMHMHHMGAIEMAKLVPDRATHQELKDLAQNIISAQTAEMQQFEDWFMAWYGMSIAGGQMDHTPGMPSTGMAFGGGTGATLLLGVALLGAALLTAGWWFRRRA